MRSGAEGGNTQNSGRQCESGRRTGRLRLLGPRRRPPAGWGSSECECRPWTGTPAPGAGGSASLLGSPVSSGHQSRVPRWGQPCLAAQQPTWAAGTWGSLQRGHSQQAQHFSRPPSASLFLRFGLGLAFALFCFNNLNNWQKLHQPMGSRPAVTPSTWLGWWPSCASGVGAGWESFAESSRGVGVPPFHPTPGKAVRRH